MVAVTDTGISCTKEQELGTSAEYFDHTYKVENHTKKYDETRCCIKKNPARCLLGLLKATQP